MKARTTRRAALGALAAAPLATVPALAAAPAETASPDLLRLIRRCGAVNAALDRACEEDRYPRCLIRGAGRLRARLTLFPSRSMADTMAKVRCIGGLAGAGFFEEEIRLALGDSGSACFATMAMGVFVELSKFGEAGPCT